MGETALPERRHLRLAVLGGGAACREFLIHLIELGQQTICASITVFEPRPTLGRGLAWSDERAPLLANMRIDTLGPSYAEYGLMQSILRDLDHPEADREYPTRNAIGVALDERWRRKAAEIPEDWHIQHVRARATDVQWDGETATVVTHDGGLHLGYTTVVLALGNLSTRRPSHLADSARFVDGWDVEAIEAIPADADVLVKGAGLTAVDATLRLLHDDRRGNGSIVWTSRSGTLPFVRPGQLKLDPQILSCDLLGPVLCQRVQDRAFSLRDLWHLFTVELDAQAVREKGNFAPDTDLPGFVEFLQHYSDAANGRAFLDIGIRGAEQPSLWFSVAKLLDEFLIPILWNALPSAEKTVFLSEWRREFDRYFEPIPLDNGLRIRQWLTEGLIQLVRTDSDCRTDPVTGKFLLHPAADDPLGERAATDLHERYRCGFDFLIDATGIASDLGTVDSELVSNLLKSSLLTPNDLGPDKMSPEAPGQLTSASARQQPSLGARIHWPTGAMLAVDGRPHGWLYTLAGSLTVGAHWYTNSFMAASASGRRVAADLVARLPRDGFDVR